jgi:hypothetical protein
MENYCVPLNLDLKIFNSDLHPVDFIKTLPEWSNEQFTKPNGNKHFRLQKDFINPGFIEFLTIKKIHLIGAEIFYTPPAGKNAIHSDVMILGSVAKINWVYGGHDSLMHWYRPNCEYNSDSALDTTRNKNTIINSPSLRFKKHEVDLIHSQAVDCPSLVEVGCPHNITNGPTDRFCISTIFANIETQKRITMEQAIQIFKDLTV